jgi:hypothetical protein
VIREGEEKTCCVSEREDLARQSEGRRETEVLAGIGAREHDLNFSFFYRSFSDNTTDGSRERG